MFNASTLPQDFRLLSSDRQTDDGWRGVLFYLTPDLRVVIASSLKTYNLQIKGMTGASFDGPSRPIWNGRGQKSLSLFLAKHSASVDGLAAACEGLPDDPALAYPAFIAAHKIMMGGYQANDWRRDDYARVVASDANVRLAVDPSGDFYRLQWVDADVLDAGPTDTWQTVAMSPRLADIKRASSMYRFDGEGPDPLDVAFAELPELASDGLWPYLRPRHTLR